MTRRADRGEGVAYKLIELETKFVDEGCIKTPIELRKPNTKFLEAEAEAEAGCKKCCEAESIKNSI